MFRHGVGIHPRLEAVYIFLLQRTKINLTDEILEPPFTISFFSITNDYQNKDSAWINF